MSIYEYVLFYKFCFFFYLFRTFKNIAEHDFLTLDFIKNNQLPKLPKNHIRIEQYSIEDNVSKKTTLNILSFTT
jgi:hypothetical protein